MMRPSPVILLLLLAFALPAIASVGCAAPPQARPNGPAPHAPPAYAELAEAHNARIAQLRRLQSRGVVEMRWRDAQGVQRREPQVDVDLYLDLPRRTAMRLSKVGNVYLWVGSDAERFWLFDFLGDERVLHVGRHDTDVLEAGAFSVGPLALLDLLGLTPLPVVNEAAAPAVRHDAALDAWVVEAPGQGGAMRVFLDRATRFPQRIESLDHRGRIVSYSAITLGRYRSVPVPGVSAATLPRLPTLLDVHALGEDDEVVGWIRLSLDEPTGFVDEGPFQRVFNLDTLRQSLRPDRVEGEAGPPA